MEGVRNYNADIVEEMLSPLSTITSRTAYTVDMAVMLLYMMSGLNLLDLLIGIPGGVFQIGINLFLAHYLKQLKSWARIATLIRAAIGIVLNFFMLGIHNANPVQLPGLTIVFLLYAIFPIIISAILLERDVKRAYQNKDREKIF
jgi:hypothetical protein